MEIIPDNVNTILSSIQSESNQNYESEFRIGVFDQHGFNSGVDSKNFYRILKHFLDHKDQIYIYIPHEISVKTEESLKITVPHEPDIIHDTIYTDRDISIRESKSGDGIDAPSFFTKKKQISKIDLVDHFIRFSKAEESPTDEKSIHSGMRSMVRHKRRWSFRVIDTIEHPLKAFQIDLTHVSGQWETYEIEFELKATVGDIKELWDTIVYILKLVQNTEFPITATIRTSVISSFNEIFKDYINVYETKMRHRDPRWTFRKDKSLYNIINKPVDLTWKEFEDFAILKNLSITDKADGERKLLYIRSDGAYLLYPPNDIIRYIESKDIDKFSKKYTRCVLDGEFVVTTDGSYKYLAFDVLAVNRDIFAQLSFKDRIQPLKRIIKDLDNNMIEAKTYLIPEKDFYINVNEMFSLISQKNYKNDGLIFNHMHEPYLKGEVNVMGKLTNFSFGVVYKWKPPEKLTIDFRIEYHPDSQQYFIYTKDDKSQDLHVFRGTRKYSFSGIIEEAGSHGLFSGQIVEMKWDSGESTFIPYRIRHDRDQPNNDTTAKNIWNNIMDPITENSIRGTDLILMRRYHNNQKRSLLGDCEKATIIDIGSGRGGDIHKWKAISAKVLAIEPNEEHLSELISRLATAEYNKVNDTYIYKDSTIIPIKMTGQDTIKIKDSFKGAFNKQTADCIIMFNVLTFFYDKEESLINLISTIDQLLKVHGHFIGIMMDGKKIRELFDKAGSDKIIEAGWSIIREAPFSHGPFGNSIKINLSETIVLEQTEYLTDFDLLKSKLEEKNIFLTETYFLENKGQLSASQKKLNELYRVFRFLRHAPKKSEQTEKQPEPQLTVEPEPQLTVEPEPQLTVDEQQERQLRLAREQRIKAKEITEQQKWEAEIERQKTERMEREQQETHLQFAREQRMRVKAITEQEKTERKERLEREKQLQLALKETKKEEDFEQGETHTIELKDFLTKKLKTTLADKEKLEKTLNNNISKLNNIESQLSEIIVKARKQVSKTEAVNLLVTLKQLRSDKQVIQRQIEIDTDRLDKIKKNIFQMRPPKGPKIIPGVFKKGEFGDFNWMIKQPEFKAALFIFNDNLSEHKTAKKGRDDDAIRIYNKYGQYAESPKSAGISISPNYVLFTKIIKTQIDNDIEEIKQLITKHDYKRIFWPATNIYGNELKTHITLNPSIKKYIVGQIKQLGIPLSILHAKASRESETQLIHQTTFKNAAVLFKPLTVPTVLAFKEPTPISLDFVKDKNLIKIGLEDADCPLSAIQYAMGKHTKPEDHNSEDLNKFITFIKPHFNTVPYKQYYKDWTDYENTLTLCSNLSVLNLWNYLSAFYKIGIILVTNETPFESTVDFFSDGSTDRFIILTYSANGYNVIERSPSKQKIFKCDDIIPS